MKKNEGKKMKNKEEDIQKSRKKKEKLTQNLAPN